MPTSARIKSHTGRGDVVRVNQEVNHVLQLFTANIWLGVGCGNTIHDRSKGQRNQLHTSRREREGSQ